MELLALQLQHHTSKFQTRTAMHLHKMSSTIDITMDERPTDETPQPACDSSSQHSDQTSFIHEADRQQDCSSGSSPAVNSLQQTDLDTDITHSGKRKRPRDVVRHSAVQGKQRGPLPDLHQQTHDELNSNFLSLLQHWTSRMQSMQPKCNFDCDVFNRSLAIMYRYMDKNGVRSIPFHNARQLQSDLAACLWLSSKADGIRSCVPSRTLITKATEVLPCHISMSELSILESLEWNLNIIT
eukprot:jgi/Botrbrau1/272/Bobra.0022s0241.1